MPESWNELAHEALKEQREPITASTTNIAKFGAPIVAVITAVVTGIFGASTDLSLKDPTTVIAAAIIVAAVVLEPSHREDAERIEAQLGEWVRGRLRSSRTPERFVVRDELPHNETGKLLRRVLRDELARPTADASAG